MIGFYNVSVILTYVGLACAVVGMTQAISGRTMTALVLLAVSGVCDLFDGRIARATKRSEDAKAFGIQIDSLCDLVCFGAAPAVFCYCIGMSDAVGVLFLILFVLAAVIRLGYFNVTETARQRKTTEKRKYYEGLPVTSIALLLPALGTLHAKLKVPWRPAADVLMGVVALLFVLKIRVRKPGNLFAGITLAACMLLVVFFLLSR